MMMTDTKLQTTILLAIFSSVIKGWPPISGMAKGHKTTLRIKATVVHKSRLETSS